MIYPAENARIQLLIIRCPQSVLNPRIAAMDIARIYRRAVLKNGKDGTPPHFASFREWRPKFIRSYLDLKRFALTGREPE